MKFRIFSIFFLLTCAVFSQTEVYFFKDTSSSLSLESVQKKEFTILNEQILDSYTQYTYWFKIPAYSTDAEYIFRILYERIYEADAYQGLKKVIKIPNQRFLSYQFSRDTDIYIKVKPKLHGYIPVELKSKNESIRMESNHLLLNGFYYGFAFLVIVFNFFYYILFKDDAFLYYSLFLASMSFGVFIMDGMFNYLNLNQGVNNLLMVSNYIILAFFSSKFVNSYLFLDNYYPRLKIFSYTLGVFIIIIGFLYLNLKNYYYLLLLSALVFTILLVYWVSAVLLFRKNIYTKILAIAYVIILFSGIDFFVLKFLGFSLLNTNSTNIKVGAFLEMIILSIAVLYRMKVLKEENELMTREIVNYAKQITLLTSKNKETNNISELSTRERQIFNLIVQLKSNKEIANHLNVSVNTIKFHIKNIYEKLNIKSRKEVLSLKNTL